jgi:hypothetical protein
MSAARSTTDHETIRRWVEARGGFPARVVGTGAEGRGTGVLRIDYPGFSGESSLERISWEAFFETFDANELAFLYQDEQDSRFGKLVSRDSVDEDEGEDDEGSAEDDDEDEKAAKKNRA